MGKADAAECVLESHLDCPRYATPSSYSCWLQHSLSMNTNGTCTYGECVGGYCICPEGSCAKDGKCVKLVSASLSELLPSDMSEDIVPSVFALLSLAGICFAAITRR